MLLAKETSQEQGWVLTVTVVIQCPLLPSRGTADESSIREREKVGGRKERRKGRREEGQKDRSVIALNFMIKKGMLVIQLTLCNSTDCGLPDSSVHGNLEARILERVAFPFSRGPS